MPRTKPEHKPTEKDRQTVSVMVAAGIAQDSIARCIGIDAKTLRKHYREELDTAAEKANAKIAQSLFQQAVGGNTAAAIWWTKSKMGWKDSTRIENEHSGPNGGPIPGKIEIEYIKAKSE